MQIFIDESGDPGFKIDEGSSRFFIVALVIFDQDLEALAAKEALTQLKIKWHEHASFEFKFTKLSRQDRLAVLSTASQFDFKIRAVIFDKVKMHELQLKHFQKNYYQYALRSLLDRPNGKIEQAIIKIDTFGQDYYRQNLLDYFGKHIGEGKLPVMEKLIFEDSKFNVLIQLADSVAGALRKSFEMKGNDSNIYREVLEDHEEDIKVFTGVLHKR